MPGQDLKLIQIQANANPQMAVAQMAENIKRLQILLDGLTGEEKQSWTPVQRDGSIPFEGPITSTKGELMISSLSNATGAINMGGLRRTLGGATAWLEHSSDGVEWDKFVKGEVTDLSTPVHSKVAGGPIWTRRNSVRLHTLTEATTLREPHELALLDGTTGSFTIKLKVMKEALFHLKKTDVSMNTITVQGESGLIDGQASTSLDTQNQAVTICCDGTNFWIVNSYG